MRGLSWILLLALSACAGAPRIPSVTVPPQREAAVFNLNGRFAVHHLEQRYSGGLRWQHQPSRDELLLQGPLGFTVARVASDARSATLERNGKSYAAQDVESLMQQVLGWGLPLPVLHHWLLGAADTASPSDIERDALGRIAVLRQAGWEVRYQRYADEGAGGLPSRILLRRDDLEVQLLLDEWEFDPQ